MALQQGRVGTRGNRDPLARPAADADPETVMRWLLEVNHAQMDQLREQVQKQGQAMDNIVAHVTTLTTTHGDSVTEINTHLKAMTEKLTTTEDTEGDTEEVRAQKEIARRMRINPPIFKGKKGERPEAHILRAKDWMDAIGVTREEDKIRYFRLTLDHLAREWYNDTGAEITDWTEMKQEFSKHFSTQGKSILNLHERWRKFTFNPDTDDIEEFLRNVQECAKQLKYDDDITLTTIKTCMPKSLYGTLWEKKSLTDTVTFLKELYAKPMEIGNPKEDQDSHSQASPFSHIKQDPSTQLEGTLNKLSDALYKLDIAKPYKPYIAPRGKGRGRGLGNRGGNSRGTGRPFEFQGSGKMTFSQRGYQRGRGRGKPRGKFDKSPTQKKPRVAPRSKDMDRERCRFCKQLGHWERECPEKKKQGDTVKSYSDWAPEEYEFYGGLEERTAPRENAFLTLQEVYASDPTPIEEMPLDTIPSEPTPMETDSLNF